MTNSMAVSSVAEKKMLLETLDNSLKLGVVTVTFTKVSGDKRVMKCTKNFGLIPTELYPQQDALPQAKNANVTRVFDLEINEWRSFRNDSVTEWDVNFDHS